MRFYITPVVKNGKNDGGRFSAVLAVMDHGVDNNLFCCVIPQGDRPNPLETGRKPSQLRYRTIQAGY
jgi:hypothetical protein